MALLSCTQYPPPLLFFFFATLFICCCAGRIHSVQKVLIARHREARLALFLLQGEEERDRRGPSRLRREKKKKHTRPVMQKHRFNVRLGSVISNGERKKLGWTGRKKGDGDYKWRKQGHIQGPKRMPVILLMEHSKELFERIEPTKRFLDPGPPRWSLWEWLHRGRYPYWSNCCPLFR